MMLMKNEKRYSLASTTFDAAEISAMHAVINSGNFTMGEAVRVYESNFAKHFGSRYAVMVNSGSSANLLAVAALCYKKERPLVAGDEVIVPSLSWSTTYYPVHQYGLKLVFVDIDLHTLNIDCEQLQSAMSERTRAILVPNILGNPADLIYLSKFCADNNLYLIEDNCESMGALVDGKHAGTYGVCGTFSSFFSHHISTMEGGMIVTDDEEIYHLLLSLRAHGWTRQLPKINKLTEKSDNAFYESFRFILPGYNVRPLEMSGAIGIEQLKKLDDMIAMRRQNAKLFQSLFSNDDRFIIQNENEWSSWFGFSLIANKIDRKRDDIVEGLIKAGIEVRPIVSGNFLKSEVIRLLNHKVVGQHLNAEKADSDGFFVGNHHYDLTVELNYLSSVLNELC